MLRRRSCDSQAVPVMSRLIIEILVNFSLFVDFVVEGTHSASLALLALAPETLLQVREAYIAGSRLIHKRMVQFLKHGVGVLALDSFNAARPTTLNMSYVSKF